MCEIPFTLFPGCEDLVPRKQHQDDAAFDLRSRVDTVLAPQQFLPIPTGVSIALPQDFEAQIRPRSGLAAKYGITVLNAPGTIDAGYRGEIQAILINHGSQPFTICRGDRIAQMLIQKLPQVSLKLVSQLDQTQRGEAGFGSTGTK